MTIIDIDDCEMWTANLQWAVRSVAEHYEGSGSTSSDLWLTDDDRATILATLVDSSAARPPSMQGARS